MKRGLDFFSKALKYLKILCFSNENTVLTVFTFLLVSEILGISKPQGKIRKTRRKMMEELLRRNR